MGLVLSFLKYELYFLIYIMKGQDEIDDFPEFLFFFATRFFFQKKHLLKTGK